ncbi:MAG: GIY-YIG nuclease family protein [Gammaproteobacteria bacterium]|nr:GIY-YIG nuclease family protein [Gammaproteobacteria bacterium]
MTTKQRILDEIKRLAVIRGGRISIRAFCSETGIPEHHILGLHWAKWNDALSEAGVSTGSFFVPRTEDSSVIEAFVQLIKKLRKWPTQLDLQMERRRNKNFPSVPVVRRVKKTTRFASRIVSYCAERTDLAEVARIATEVEKAEIEDAPVEKNASIVGYVYMMKSGRKYKIGHTNSPTRRHREVRLDLPDPTLVVHTIATDDPSGVESYWHERFQAKRVRDTEFFSLDANDVAAFKRWKRIA